MAEWIRRAAPALVTLATLVVLWEVLGAIFGLRQVIAPLPSAVVSEFHAKWAQFPRHAAVTRKILFPQALSYIFPGSRAR